MELRTLESTPYTALHAAFLAAFSDYALPVNLTEAQLAEMHRRRGVRLDLSVGVFDGEAILGFTFNGHGRWNGSAAGYDSGTGVIPSARGRRLASLMMKRSLEILGDAGATCYVLEVLRDNTRAFRVYENIGFRVTRELDSWVLDGPSRLTGGGTAIETATSLDGIPSAEMRDWQPSWQNSDDSIHRAAEPKTILVAREGDRVDGYAVVFSSGDLAQLAVGRSRRRQGIGTALLHAAREACGKPLRFINIDATDRESAEFLTAVGAAPLLSQYEMIVSIGP